MGDELEKKKQAAEKVNSGPEDGPVEENRDAGARKLQGQQVEGLASPPVVGATGMPSAGPRNEIVDGAEQVEEFATHRPTLEKRFKEDESHIQKLLEARRDEIAKEPSPDHDQLVEKNTCEFVLEQGFEVLFPLHNENVNLNEGYPVWFWVGRIGNKSAEGRGLGGSFSPQTEKMRFRRTENAIRLRRKPDDKLLQVARHEVQHFADRHVYGGNNVGWEDSLERVKTEFRGRIAGGKSEAELGKGQLMGDEGIVSVIDEFGLDDNLANRILTDILINYDRKENDESLLSLYRSDEGFRAACNEFANKYADTPLSGADKANPEGINPMNSIRIHHLHEFVAEHWTGIEYLFGADKPHEDLEKKIAALDATDRAVVKASTAWKAFVDDKMLSDSKRFWGHFK